MAKFSAIRATTGDNHVGLPATCCDELVKPREALFVRRAGTRDIRLHVGCVCSAIENAPVDMVDFPSAERARQLIAAS